MAVKEEPKRVPSAEEPDPALAPGEKSPTRWGRWLCAIAALLVLAGWLSHERAKGQLEAYKRQLIAKGEKLTIDENLPPTPVGVTNGAKAFLSAASGLGRVAYDSEPGARLMVAPGRGFASWQQSRLPAYQMKNQPVDDVWPPTREAVTLREEQLAEIALALNAPLLAFDIPYHTSWPHLATGPRDPIIQSSQWLRDATLVQLRDGRHEEAWTNWLAATRLLSRQRIERETIAQLTRSSLISSSDGLVWACLQSGQWSESQLARIQSEWQAVATGDFAESYRMERARISEFYQTARVRPSEVWGCGPEDLPPASEIVGRIADKPGLVLDVVKHAGRFALWPLWNSYEDEQLHGEFIQSLIEAAETARTTYCVTNAWVTVDAALGKMTNVSTKFIFSWSSYHDCNHMKSMFRSWARAVMTRDVVVTAIALRRYQLRHDRYPARLDALVPEFLPSVPRDIFDGQPLRYRLQADGQFLLYSVGEDGVDDGGDPRHATRTDTFAWHLGRDCVWPQPASAAEVAAYIADIGAKILMK